MLKSLEHDSIVIRGARVIDPFAGRDEVADVAIVNGLIVRSPGVGATVIDADGWILCPGLMDMHVHLREPGQTHKETIETGTTAAAAGGFTSVACMPNTVPTLDNPATIRAVVARAVEVGRCGVMPVGAMTMDRAGKEVADFQALREAGAVAFSDDGVGVEDDAVMRAVFERAQQCDMPLIQHCEISAISAGGVMHLGDVSARLGLAGLDPRSEEAMIERDIDLCRRTGGRYHVAHISTAKAVELVRVAKSQGLPVTAEVCTHHLLLTDEACSGGDPNSKMHPPLRPEHDVDACRAGLVDGTIDCIVTDHAPHSAEEKGRGFAEAPPGIVGLETAIGLAIRAMVETQLLHWPELIAKFTTGPSDVLKLPSRPIHEGATADVTLIDPAHRWKVEPREFESKGRSTPFSGWELVGRPAGTIRGRWCNLVREVSGVPGTADQRE